MSLQGKVALVTGGGRGIGKACALALAAKGADVAIAYRRGKEAADETVREIEKLGRRAMAVACDVAVEEQARALTKEVIERMGKIDILVCNAGVASRGLPVKETTTDEFRRLFDTHVMGSLWCIQGALDSMRAQGRGHIVLVSSIATLSCGERTAPYTMAKAALEALTKVLSKEEGPNGVRVNCIGPGLVDTEMGKRLVKGRSGEDIKDLYAKYPFGRVAQPEDIGNLCAFLCSPEAEYVSGQVVWVHGGGFEKHEVV